MELDTNFQTPKEVCRYMASLVPTGSKKILEPTPGLGNIVEALNKEGFTPEFPEDYFQERNRYLKQDWDCIVMNPPFSSKSAYMENAPDEWKNHTGMKFGYKLLLEMMLISDHIIALMPWFTISDSDVRLRTLQKFGIRSITALPRKTFQYARIQTMVLELDRNYKGSTEFKVFDALEKPIQYSLLNSIV